MTHFLNDGLSFRFGAISSLSADLLIMYALARSFNLTYLPPPIDHDKTNTCMTTVGVVFFCFFFLLTVVSGISCALSANLSQGSDEGGGEWHLLHESLGISVMHMQLLPNNKVVMFDRTEFGPSNLSLPPALCSPQTPDCTAHSLLYCLHTDTFHPLKLQTDTWCSSGSLLPNGTLAQTGGFNDGDHVLRMFTPCHPPDFDKSSSSSCDDWVEFPSYLSRRRWYASNHILPDGRVIIVGGRRQFNYEFYPRSPDSSNLYSLDFLRETRDAAEENNLYPFLHLLPDGNLFIFANTRSISLDYKINRVAREFPPIPGGHPRNYPSSGSSVLLPLNDTTGGRAVEAEVFICGGALPGAAVEALQGNFMLAEATCGRLKVSDEEPEWVMEEMPVGRVMGDMLLLPTGDVLIVNGARLGTAGWECGRSPVRKPLIYQPGRRRFKVMSGSTRPRMYHSSAVLVPDGRVLVGGSNPHVRYNFTDVVYPTDLSLEAYSPPYTSSAYSALRPQIVSLECPEPHHHEAYVIGYGQSFSVVFEMMMDSPKEVAANIVAPSFSTHTVGMNQRMVGLRVERVKREGCCGERRHRLSGVGPSTPEIAPPGFYMLFLVHPAGIPSRGVWVQIH